MTLLETYIEKNEDVDWFLNHSSLAKGRVGRMFEYTTTNFRTQNTFTEDFEKFFEIENLDRGTWPKQEDHGQEIHKQYVIPMLQSKLFKKDQNGVYSRTAKGILYSNFINLEISDEERWLINYIFLLNGYYLDRKNYIIYRVKEDLLGSLLIVEGITKEFLVKSAEDLLKLSQNTLSELLRSTFFYLHSFYNDSDFLINYLRSSENEKEELAQYIENNINAETLNCCISKKYQRSGNFNKSMLLDETRVFLMTLLFIHSKDINLTNIQEIFVENFNQHISEINKKDVLSYILGNKNVFDPIFEDVLELDDIDIRLSENTVAEVGEIGTVDTPQEYIDETSEIGKQKIKAIFNLLKRQARIQSDYTCALESINNCRPIYFTAKASGENYLELHHFIPREFRNNFPHSIEVLANYVTLCPRCHRQIHLAIDRERVHLINALYTEREKRLEIVGLKLERSEIYSYYKIDK